MNDSLTSRRSMAAWLLAFSLVALMGLTAIAGCASDSGSRSDFDNSHAGHNH